MQLRHTIIALVAVLTGILLPFTAGASEPETDEGWVLRTRDFEGDYTGASVANGTLGILPWREPFSVRHVILNHTFELSDASGVSCVLRGINPLQFSLAVDGCALTQEGVSEWEQEIDLKHAEHLTRFTAQDKARIGYSIVALRNMPHAALIRVEVEALEDVVLDFTNTMDVPAGEYGAEKRVHQSFLVDGTPTKLLRCDAPTLHNRYMVSAASMLIHAGEEFAYTTDNERSNLRITLLKGEHASFTLAASICSSRDFSDPRSEAERQVIYIAHQTPERILEQHRAMWRDLWQGDIEIEGDAEAQRVVRLALFNLYASVRAGSRLSIPPMGLSMQGYNGHIFWDAELWMFPPLLLMNQYIARSMIDYRYDRLAPARRRAAAYGYRGVMFPWESDWFGEESTPTWAITGPLEHHITADVAIAAWNYFRVTGDRDWLAKEGFPMMREVAEFWVSRVTRNANGSYSIEGVVGADEYANNVTDNAFTNGAVKVALRSAVKAAEVCGEKADPRWQAIADGLKIHHANGITLEYAGYAGTIIKQADVNLLAYPLGIITHEEQIRRDMAYYDRKIDQVNGPAMTYSIFAVNLARMGRAEEAETMFRRSYRPNLRPPFGVLSETPTSHNPYFVTCAGGLLQAVLNGFGGLELTDHGIEQRPSVLPPSWRKLTIRGVGPDRKTYVIE